MNNTPEHTEYDEFELTTRGYDVYLERGKVVVTIPMRQILGRHGEVTGDITIHQKKVDGSILAIKVLRETHKAVRLVIQDPEEELGPLA